MTDHNEVQFEALLEFLKQQRGFDFTGYKRPTLIRRVLRRMQMAGVEGFDSYIDYLEVHPEEFAQLFNTILINVTSFFRDEAPWEYLRNEVLPQLLAAKDPHEQVRVWSAGCASGQEAYSLAIAFAEAMGEEAFRARVKVYGTDADDDALNHARLAAYTAKDLETVDPALVPRYFEQANGRYVFRPDLRRSVIFGRHDIVQHAPISRLDLLVCRNTLMYFNAETQSKILQSFHFALNGDGHGNGYLFLGRAEMLLSHGNLFTPLNLKCRVFAKVPQPGLGTRPRLPEQANANGNGTNLMRNDRLRDLALEESPVPRIVVDADGTLSMANQKARVLFSISPKDIGRPLQDLDISYRPAELRSLIEEAYAERRSVTQTSVERRFQGGDPQYFDIMELETTNEELQSTNEELETMNEELQSTNEELQTVNEELRQRTDEMNHLNAFLESVLTGLRAAAVVVNQNLDVLVWNKRAEDLWGLRADEVQGRSLLNLDIGLPVGELRNVIRPCLGGDSDQQHVVLDAVNRRGKKIKCRVTCSPLVSASKKREGVILLMEEADA